MEVIADEDYTHEKRYCKYFKQIFLVEYSDFYVKSDTIFLADVFKNFRNTCLEIYNIEPDCFLITPGLDW